MKQKNAIYLVVAFANFAIFSCSKEEIIDLDNNAPGQKAVISIKVVGAGNNLAQSRAAGAAATTDAVINDYVAFTFREGGALDNTPFYVRFDPNQPGDVEEPRLGIGTTAAKKVYIIANVGPLADSPFANVKTEAELLAVTGDLMENSNVTTQTEDNLWMSGVNDVSFSTSPDGYIYGGTTVSLNFVAAKIELVVQDERENRTGGDIEITDKSVALLFAGKSGKFFGTDTEKAVQTEFYSGDVSYSSFSVGSATESTVLKDAVLTPFTLNQGRTVFNHFYTFANNGTSKPTILSIQSEIRTIGSNVPTPVYYPIQFTKADAGYTIEAGKHYTVEIYLGGNVAGGGGAGSLDPEKPIVHSNMTYVITSAKWFPVTVSKSFH